MKFSWGTGIFITITFFITAAAGAAIFFLNQHVDLVSDNYYEKEIRYQDRINIIKHTLDINADILIESTGDIVTFKFPLHLIQRYHTGEIVFYRPSGSAGDFRFPVNPDTNGLQIFNSGKLNKGFWKVQITWKSGDENFYSEKSILVN